MASGIKDKVAIIGMGCSKFGERWDKEAQDLMVEAFSECLEDANIEKDQIQAAWLATAIDSVNVGPSGVPFWGAVWGSVLGCSDSGPPFLLETMRSCRPLRL